MSNVIPPLLSSTPPPIGNIDDEDDDFGDFTAADYSYGCDGFSIPNTPHDTPKKPPPVINMVDINSNSNHLSRLTEKDHQDKRKDPSQLDDLSQLPNDLNTSKDDNVPSNTDYFYREEPPEIDDDDDGDFKHYEYNPGLSIDQEDDVANMELPEVVDFTCGEFINGFEEVKVREFNEINCVKSTKDTEQKFRNIINDEIENSDKENEGLKDDKVENSLKSKSESVENSEDSLNVIDDDFGDFEYHSAGNYDGLKSHDNTNKYSVVSVEKMSKFEINKEIVDANKDVKKGNKDDLNNSRNKDDFNYKHMGDSGDKCNGFDLEHNQKETTAFKSNSEAEFKMMKSAEDLKFSLNSKEETFVEAKHEVDNLKPEDYGDQHIPNTFSNNSNLEKTEQNHASDNFDLSKVVIDSQQILLCSSKDYVEMEEASKFDRTDAKEVVESVSSKVVDAESENLDSHKSSESILKDVGNCDIDDDFGDFADFRTIETKNVETTSVPENNATSRNENTKVKVDFPADEDFGNFVATNESPVFETNFPTFETKDGEFDDYTSSAEAPVMLAVDSKNIGEKAKVILEEMFPKGDQAECDEYHSFDFIAVDSVFKEIKDITDTSALRYQWGKSRTQKDLLKSLNIDIRNILYGPGINPMPKFAANLGMAPLEPMKSEILTPTPVSNPPTTSSQSNPPVTGTDIPTAQFDWSESGLANPLDSVSKEEETQNQDNTTINTMPVTPRMSFDNESVNSLQFADIPNDAEDQKPSEDDDFSDFTSFKTNMRNNMVPLRESYINNAEVKIGTSDEPGWLKPTILTPVLPRKYEPENEAEDDFTAFQMSLPLKTGLTVQPLLVEETSKSQVNVAEENATALKPGDSSALQKDDTSMDGLALIHDANVLKPAQNGGNHILQLMQNKDANHYNVTNEFVRKDEVLQPVQVFKPIEEAVINWPDPGITEEELARFEMYSKASSVMEKNDKVSIERKMSGNTGLMLVEKSVVVPANKVVLPSKEVLLPPNDKVVISKDLVLPILDSSPRKYTPLKNQRESKDEDDWTDFISNKSVQNLQIERITTPELPLSIPQLSHIQPPKLPIPVITPQGLMQTKIPSAPMVQAKNTQAILHLNPPQDGYRPAIISHQYQIQMNQNVFSGVLQNTSYQTTSIPANIRTTPTHQTHSAKSSSSSFDDSEEWTDFVSSRPTANGTTSQPKANSPHHIKQILAPQSVKHTFPTAIPQSTNFKSPQFNNWNTPIPPTNPYMSSNTYQNHVLQSYSMPHPNSLSANKNNIPSISALPDLDFVTAKNRSFSKK